MGLPSRLLVHARHSTRPGGGDDPRKAARGRGWRRAVCAGLILGALAGVARADTLRIATYNAELTRAGPGLLLRDIERGEDAQVTAVLAVLTALDADVVLMTGIDYDMGARAAGALGARAGYGHVQALRGNTGVATGLDLDGNGRLGEARDAQGFGRFAGQAGMAVLSRYPLPGPARDFSALLWADLPGALLPAGMDPRVRAVQRLSTSGHWDVPVATPGRPLHLLCWYATPPVFDGPEDRNGRRNHDEAAFWLRLLAGDLPDPPPEGAFVLLGQSNLDPADGEGLPDAMQALLSHPALQDPAPRGTAGRTDTGQRGDPTLDTALYDFGGLRVEVVLPAAGLTVRAAGVLWPPPDDPLASVLAAASRHRPVWVDLAWP